MTTPKDGKATVMGLDLVLGNQGFIFWCSDWSQIDSLVAAGLARREVGGAGTYHHVSYFLKATKEEK